MNNKQGVTVSCWVNVCKVRKEVDNDWDSATYLTYSTDYYQRITFESRFTNLEQTSLNRCQPLKAKQKV